MEIRRFFVTSDKFINKEIIIDGQEFWHLSKVLRLKKNYEVVVSLNNGFDYYGTIKEIYKQHAVVEVKKIVEAESETQAKLVLFQALPKKEHLEIILQKAVELGVDKICIFKSQFSQNYEINQERLNTIAKEASKQSGRNKLIEIQYFDEVSLMKDEVKQLDRILVFYENEKTKNLKSISKLQVNKSLGIFIGSEGGFSEEEIKYFEERYQAEMLTLGKRILRCETAAIVAITLLLYELGELG